MSENGQSTNVIELPPSLTVRELADAIGSSPIEIIKVLMDNGVMANINQQIDFDTAAIVAAEMGYETSMLAPETPVAEEVGEIPYWRQLIAGEDPENLSPRPPVVTILGHVDHGKTTLLDAIRQTDVVGGEAGGITQHIGAYQVTHNDKPITFLDTPGHAAFTAMRSRGAQGADVVVLVVAADDGVMPQTREALDHAKAAKVPIIVAMNKIDKPNANPERTKQQLAEIGLVPDDWDGETIVVPVSAKQEEGLDDLLEAILLVSENMDILANPEGRVIGSVIEAERDRARGVVATLLVQNGTLSIGDIVIAGNTYGKLRSMFDYRGNRFKEAGPSAPVSIMGLKQVPSAGDLFMVTESEKQARSFVQKRKDAAKKKASAVSGLTLENMFDRIKAGEVKELRLVVKADVQGSLEPIVSSLTGMKEGDAGVNVLRAETGNIGENDVLLASASSAVILGFNVEADTAAQRLAEKEGVSIRLYTIIYRLTEDVEKALKGMLEPEERETTLGKAEVRALFRIPRKGTIAGCYVLDGEIRRNALVRLYREDEVIHEGEMSSLRHFQEDVREVRKGFECGIGVKDFNKIEEGDIIESYTKELVPIE